MGEGWAAEYENDPGSSRSISARARSIRLCEGFISCPVRSPSSTRYRTIHYLRHTMRMLPAHSPEFFALLAQLAVEQHPDFGVLDEGDLVGLLVEARPEVDRLVDWPPTRGRSEGTSGSCAGGGEDAHEQPAADRVARRQSRQNCKGPGPSLRASGPARFASLLGCPGVVDGGFPGEV